MTTLTTARTTPVATPSTTIAAGDSAVKSHMIVIDGVEVDARIGEWSTQYKRRAARSFAAALAAGDVVGAPAGCRIEASDRGADVVLPTGGRHSVTSQWAISRLMSWWDDVVTPEERLRTAACYASYRQITRGWARQVIEWVIVDAQVATGTATTSKPSTSDK